MDTNISVYLLQFYNKQVFFDEMYAQDLLLDFSDVLQVSKLLITVKCVGRGLYVASTHCAVFMIRVGTIG